MSIRLAMKVGLSISCRWNGMFVFTPRILNSESARRIRRIAWPRVSPQQISLAMSES